MQLTAEAMVESVRQTIQMAVNDRNYKHGAFKDAITKNASALEGLDILLKSPLLSESEKKIVSNTRDIVTYDKDKWANLSGHEALLKSLPLMSLSEMFEEDMGTQGQYVPPMTAYTFDSASGNVKSTHVIDNDGCQTTPGGVVGTVPGAPAEFNAVNAKYWKDMGFGPKKAKNDQADPDAASKENARKGAKGKPKQGHQFYSVRWLGANIWTDHEGKEKFGTAFEKNIRNAFL